MRIVPRTMKPVQVRFQVRSVNKHDDVRIRVALRAINFARACEVHR